MWLKAWVKMFIKYNTAGCKEQVRDLLRKRLALKDKIRYHLAKISNIKDTELPGVEKKLQFYLDRAE